MDKNTCVLPLKLACYTESSYKYKILLITIDSLT